MHIPEHKERLLAQIASAADHCMKPYLHAVLDLDKLEPEQKSQEIDDLILRIECRDLNGNRLPQNDLDLEVYRSGEDLSIMVSKVDSNDNSILWHCRHSMWMNGDTGISCESPIDGVTLEAFARRIRSFLL